MVTSMESECYLPLTPSLKASPPIFVQGSPKISSSTMTPSTITSSYVHAILCSPSNPT